jgi:anionic cell wall polymer biosynthesis LytR-Cps2A-Psr (LCP) family protein
VLIEEGYQLLDGEHLFYYVHYRDVYGQQNDRMERHQRIIQSAFEQFRSVGKLSKILRVLSTIRNNLVTNLDNRYIGALMQFATELEMENIKFYTFEGEGMFTEYGYYFYIDEAHRAAVVEEFLGVEVEELGIVKGIPFEFDEEEEELENTLDLFSDWD